MKPIEKTTITDLVVANIKDLITSGDIPVNEKLPTENEICRQLNVGRSTVREAFRVLQAMGYVKMYPGRGAFVAKTKEDNQASIINWFVEHELQLTDFMEVRAAIETLGVKLAVLKATEKEIQAIEKVLISFENALENDAIEKLPLLDEAFHNSIIKATHNNLLIPINQKVSDAFMTYRTMSFAVKGNAINALGPHREIFDALKRRDVEKAISAMNKHIDISLRDISNIVNK